MVTASRGLHVLHALEREVINQQQQVVETRRQASRVADAAVAAATRPVTAQNAVKQAQEALRRHADEEEGLRQDAAAVAVRAHASCLDVLLCVCFCTQHEATQLMLCNTNTQTISEQYGYTFPGSSLLLLGSHAQQGLPATECLFRCSCEMCNQSVSGPCGCEESSADQSAM